MLTNQPIPGEKQVDKALEAGLADHGTLYQIVGAGIIVGIAIAGVWLYLKIRKNKFEETRIKLEAAAVTRKQNQDAEAAERKLELEAEEKRRLQDQQFHIEKLEREHKLEESRLQQSQQIATATLHIRSTAESLERTHTSVANVLGTAHDVLKEARALRAEIPCKGVKQP